MKALLINGSPHREGCTYTALRELADTLLSQGIEAEILWLGTEPISGCTACGACRKNGLCIRNDAVNKVLAQLDGIDAIVVGSPVYYSGASGQLVSFLDRIFFAGRSFDGKLGASVVSCRRGGGTATFEQLNQYFLMNNMPVVASQYWNQVHGFTPDDVRRDEEGLQTMRTLGRNMAWLLKCIEAGRQAGLPLPEHEPMLATNFIR